MRTEVLGCRSYCRPTGSWWRRQQPVYIQHTREAGFVDLSVDDGRRSKLRVVAHVVAARVHRAVPELPAEIRGIKRSQNAVHCLMIRIGQVRTRSPDNSRTRLAAIGRHAKRNGIGLTGRRED